MVDADFYSFLKFYDILERQKMRTNKAYFYVIKYSK